MFKFIVKDKIEIGRDERQYILRGIHGNDLFFPSLEFLLDFLLEHKLLEIKVETVNDFKTEIQRVRKELKELIKNLDEYVKQVHASGGSL